MGGGRGRGARRAALDHLGLVLAEEHDRPSLYGRAPERFSRGCASPAPAAAARRPARGRPRRVARGRLVGHALRSFPATLTYTRAPCRSRCASRRSCRATTAALARALPAELVGARRALAEMVVVDNGSADGSVEWLREASRRCGSSRSGATAASRAPPTGASRGRARLRRGRARQHRRGARAGLARRGWRARSPPTPAAAAVATQDGVAGRPGASSTTPATCSAATASASSAGASGPTTAAGTSPERCSAPARARRCIGATRFVAAGGFDERFFAYLEDVDLALRLRLGGWGCRYEPRPWRCTPAAARRAAGERPSPLVERNTLLLCARAYPARWWLGPVLYRQLARGIRCAPGRPVARLPRRGPGRAPGAAGVARRAPGPAAPRRRADRGRRARATLPRAASGRPSRGGVLTACPTRPGRCSS